MLTITNDSLLCYDVWRGGNDGQINSCSIISGGGGSHIKYCCVVLSLLITTINTTSETSIMLKPPHANLHS